jgi:hypothetical protein
MSNKHGCFPFQWPYTVRVASPPPRCTVVQMRFNAKNAPVIWIHRLNLERLNLEWDFCPNGLNPEWNGTEPRMGLNPE